MKIRVTTKSYEYMGLCAGVVVEIDEAYTQDGQITGVRFTLNGKYWALDKNQFEIVQMTPQECRSSYCGCEEGKCSGGKVDMRADEAEKTKAKGPIKSDGGSSTYYDIYLPEWLMRRMVEREVDGKVYIKTEEIIECFFESDFDFSNAFKSLVRAYGAFNGGGKAGNDVNYEVKKIQYSCDKIKDRFERKEKK